MEAKNQRLDPDFLKCIPLSVQEKSPYRTNGIKYYKMLGSYQQDKVCNVRTLHISLIDKLREIIVKYDHCAIEGSQYLSQPSTYKASSGGSLFLSFFGTLKKKNSLANEKSLSLARAWKQLFAQVLFDQISLHIRDKTKASQCAQAYSDIVVSI